MNTGQYGRSNTLRSERETPRGLGLVIVPIALALPLLVTTPCSAQTPQENRSGIPVAGVPEPGRPAGQPHILDLVRSAHWLCRQDIAYRFGADDPGEGGLDCSGAIQFLMTRLGIRGVPRTAYTQYQWCRKSGQFRKPRFWQDEEDILKDLRPGELLFWSGTYKTSKPVSHVMIYAGRDPKTGRPVVFGARGTDKRGMHGSGVDFFPLTLRLEKGAGYLGSSRIPGLRY